MRQDGTTEQQPAPDTSRQRDAVQGEQALEQHLELVGASRSPASRRVARRDSWSAGDEPGRDVRVADIDDEEHRRDHTAPTARGPIAASPGGRCRLRYASARRAARSSRTAAIESPSPVSQE